MIPEKRGLSPVLAAPEGDARLIAFYLPQFHPIPENDLWWGKGFTEWTNVAKARPLYPGHYQPRLPADLGFYDLRLPEAREAQAELARAHGIHGFCYYHYWFNGKRLLQRPLEEVLALKRPDFPFCICWANESWTRRWDGGDSEVLMPQQHSHEDDVAFIHSLLPYFSDARYIRVGGKPLLLVYRTALFPDPGRTAETWRECMHKAGVGDIFLARVESFGTTGSEHLAGFDAGVQFPGHKIPQSAVRQIIVDGKILPPKAFDFDPIIQYLLSERPDYTLFKSVSVGWDNTPRRGKNGSIFVNGTPQKYGAWLRQAVADTRERYRPEERLVFIAAWNEWAEGNHLEPDQKYGLEYLAATKAALA